MRAFVLQRIELVDDIWQKHGSFMHGNAASSR